MRLPDCDGSKPPRDSKSPSLLKKTVFFQELDKLIYTIMITKRLRELYIRIFRTAQKKGLNLF